MVDRADATTLDFANILKEEAYGLFAARQLEAVEAVPTPFPGLNAECRGDGGRQGLAFGWHVILAGATNQGKSNMAMNMACRAVQEGYAVMIVSARDGSPPDPATDLLDPIRYGLRGPVPGPLPPGHDPEAARDGRTGDGWKPAYHHSCW
jgi:hypothetical protein